MVQKGCILQTYIGTGRKCDARVVLHDGMPVASISLVTSQNLPMSTAMDENMLMSLLNAAVALILAMDGAMQLPRAQ
jgi:hypothetical protein